MKYYITWDNTLPDNEVTHEYYTGVDGEKSAVDFREQVEFSRSTTKMKKYDSLHECSGDLVKLSRIYEGCDLRIGSVI